MKYALINALSTIASGQNITSILEQLDESAIQVLARGRKHNDEKAIVELNSCAIGAHTCPDNADCHTLINWAHEVFYQCRCRPGYQQIHNNGHLQCIDINECVQDKDPCPRESDHCQNLIGSYVCLGKPSLQHVLSLFHCKILNEHFSTKGPYHAKPPDQSGVEGGFL